MNTKKAIIYESSTGLIIKRITGTIDAIKSNCFEGESICYDYDEVSTYIVDDKPVLIQTKVSPEYLKAKLKVDRLKNLKESDWTQLPDVNLTPEQREAWSIYRQALRDYPSTVIDPSNPPPFPIKPI